MKPKAIIFDIDGTLADCRHRLHHLPNYDKFFAEMDKDTLIAPVAYLLNKVQLTNDKAATVSTEFKFQNTLEILIVTGRPDKYKPVTLDWLQTHRLRFTDLYMRKTGDPRPDHVIKDEIRQEIEKTYDIRLVIDDRPKVVAMWRRAGHLCLQNEYTKLPKYAPGKLVMLIGPSGAGKDSWIKKHEVAAQVDFTGKNIEVYRQVDAHRNKWVICPTASIVSSDALRQHLCGDFRDQSKNAQVFELFHALVKTHLEHGGNVVANATHIKRADRLATLACAPASAEIEYVVIDRPLADKIRDGGWRNEVHVKGLPLINYHHQVFQSNLKDILAGDNDPRVTVKDLR